MSKEPHLERDASGLFLVTDDLRLKADLTSMLPRLKPGKLQGELLVKAARTKGTDHPTAVDATAGLGNDALLLAAAGFEVTLFERDPVIAALLEDSLARAATDPRLSEAVFHMHLRKGDSIIGLTNLDFTPDVVVLDPMFPARQKSAAVKKKFQLLHLLEAPCPDEKELLDAALAASPRKIVIKRPVKGPFLADAKPNYQLKGKAVRYDIIVPAAQPH